MPGGTSTEPGEAPDDPLRTYTDQEERRLSTNLAALQSDIVRGEYRAWPVGLPLASEFHSRLFANVRPRQAGRHRRPGRGDEHVTFGPNRSTHRDRVEVELARIFERVERSARSCEENSDAPEFTEAALRTAVYLQAELIRVHPFFDGNGRTSRALMDALLVRLGLRPIPIEAVREEYRAALNEHHASMRQARKPRIDPLFDLYVRLYTDHLLPVDENSD